jgi:hypothetical protein
MARGALDGLAQRESRFQGSILITYQPNVLGPANYVVCYIPSCKYAYIYNPNYINPAHNNNILIIYLLFIQYIVVVRLLLSDTQFYPLTGWADRFVFWHSARVAQLGGL